MSHPAKQERRSINPEVFPSLLKLKEAGLTVEKIGTLQGHDLYVALPDGMNLHSLIKGGYSDSVSAEQLLLINFQSFVANERRLGQLEAASNGRHFDPESLEVSTALVIHQDKTVSGNPYVLVPRVSGGDNSELQLVSGIGPDGRRYKEPINGGTLRVVNVTESLPQSQVYDYQDVDGEPQLLSAIKYEEFIDDKVDDRLAKIRQHQLEVAAIAVEACKKEMKEEFAAHFSVPGLLIFLLQRHDVYEDQTKLRQVLEAYVRQNWLPENPDALGLVKTGFDEHGYAVWAPELTEVQQYIVSAGMELVELIQQKEIDPRELSKWMAELIAHRIPAVDGMDTGELIDEIANDRLFINKLLIDEEVFGDRNAASIWMKQNLSRALVNMMENDKVKPEEALQALQQIMQEFQGRQIVEILTNELPINQMGVVRNQLKEIADKKTAANARTEVANWRENFIADYIRKAYPKITLEGLEVQAARITDRQLADNLHDIILQFYAEPQFTFYGNESEVYELKEIFSPGWEANMVEGLQQTGSAEAIHAVLQLKAQIHKYQNILEQVAAAVTEGEDIPYFEDYVRQLLSQEYFDLNEQARKAQSSRKIGDLKAETGRLMAGLVMLETRMGVMGRISKSWYIMTSRSGFFGRFFEGGDDEFETELWKKLRYGGFRDAIPGYGTHSVNWQTPEPLQHWLIALEEVVKSKSPKLMSEEARKKVAELILQLISGELSLKDAGVSLEKLAEAQKQAEQEEKKKPANADEQEHLDKQIRATAEELHNLLVKVGARQDLTFETAEMLRNLIEEAQRALGQRKPKNPYSS